MGENGNFTENNGNNPQNPYYENPYYRATPQPPVNYGIMPNWNTYSNCDETEYFKRTLRKVGNGIGLQLILFFVISVVVSFVVGIFAGVATAITNVNYLADVNFMLVLNSLISIIGMVLPAFLTEFITKIKIRDVVPIALPSAVKTLAVVMLGLGVASLSNIASSIFGSIYYSVFGQQTIQNDMEYGSGLFSLIISVITVAVIPAVVEEFAFRGVILGTLRKYISDGAAIFVSTLFFSIIHGNLVQIPFAFGLGFILAYVTVYTKSLLPAVIIHFINNTMSVVLSFVVADMSPVAGAVVTYLYLALLLLIGICGLILLLATDKSAFKLPKNNAYRSKEKVKWLFGSPAVIVFIVICAIEVVIIQLTPYLTKFFEQLTQYAG